MIKLCLANNGDADIINLQSKAADGIVPYTVLNRPGKKTEFRKKAESYLAASANVEAAKNLLKEAGITASDYEFSITVASYKEDHIAMAELAKAAWKALGFKVDVKVLKPTEVMETTVDATTGVETTYQSFMMKIY